MERSELGSSAAYMEGHRAAGNIAIVMRTVQIPDVKQAENFHEDEEVRAMDMQIVAPVPRLVEKASGWVRPSRNVSDVRINRGWNLFGNRQTLQRATEDESGIQDDGYKKERTSSEYLGRTTSCK